jgi:hypothetical protein
MSMFGINIVPSINCWRTRTEFKVTTWATKSKRRKNWRVCRIDIHEPCAYQVGNTIYAHPTLIEKMKKGLA